VNVVNIGIVVARMMKDFMRWIY